jgi:phosphatidylglycerophosphatase A
VAGVGYAPIAPGTVGSAATVLVLWLFPVSVVSRLVFLLVVTVAGIAASTRVERLTGRKDPGIIVVDEVAGMTLSVLWLPLTPAVLVVAFLLFRAFDIVKPFPADRSQRLRGGLGVMVDDLIAGAYALVALAGVRAVLGVPA